MQYPRISCLCPTYGRRAYLAQTLRYFQRQTYPNKELCIIEDGEECNEDVVPETMYYHLGPLRHTIGCKRNAAFSRRLVSGEYVCHWDDDDYFGPERLMRQMEPVLDGRADVTGMHMSLVYAVRDGMLWQCSDTLHAALFPSGIRCGTLLYPARYWYEGARYPDSSQGEDVALLRQLQACGATVESITHPTSYICVRHGENSSNALFLDAPSCHGLCVLPRGTDCACAPTFGPVYTVGADGSAHEACGICVISV